MVTFLSIPSGLFLLAGIVASCIAAAIFCALVFLKRGDNSRFARTAAVCIAFVIATAGLLWVGHQSWYLSSSGNYGFGPDWECTIPKTGAEVCIRNVKRPPAMAPSAGTTN
jgi:hypothetical protein